MVKESVGTALTNHEAWEMQEKAYAIITARTHDYPDLKVEAEQLAAIEGVSLDELTYDVGYKGSYTAVPRRYHQELGSRLIRSFLDLSSDEETPFVHVTDSKIIAGWTPALLDDGLKRDKIRLEPVNDGRACNLVLPRSYLTSMSMVPYINVARDYEPQDSVGSITLRLGRDILNASSTWREVETAVMDSYRTWETVLVVGDRAIADYLVEMRGTAEEHLPKTPGISRVRALEMVINEKFSL